MITLNQILLFVERFKSIFAAITWLILRYTILMKYQDYIVKEMIIYRISSYNKIKITDDNIKDYIDMDDKKLVSYVEFYYTLKLLQFIIESLIVNRLFSSTTINITIGNGEGVLI